MEFAFEETVPVDVINCEGCGQPLGSRGGAYIGATGYDEETGLPWARMYHYDHAPEALRIAYRADVIRLTASMN